MAKENLSEEMKNVVNIQEKDGEIDEGLYSRQLYVYGRDAQKSLKKSRILVLGMSGLGVEIAKNLVLAGVDTLHVYDPVPKRVNDMGANFYLCGEAGLGENGVSRARECENQLKSLNRYVNVGVVEDFELNDLKMYSVVVAVGRGRGEVMEVSEFCHRNGVKFIATETRGVFGKVFCDFLKDFKVTDQDGTTPTTCMIASIVEDVVTVTEEKRHGLGNDDIVVFKEIKGRVALNDQVPRKITVTGSHTFKIHDAGAKDDTDHAATTTGRNKKDLTTMNEMNKNADDTVQNDAELKNVAGGYVTQVKKERVMQFRQYKDALKNPGEFLTSDFGKMEHAGILHVGFQCLDEFYEKFNYYPKDQKDIDSVVNSGLEKINGDVDVSLVKKLLKLLAKGANSEITPMCAIFGGIVAQETIKACTGKFTPIHQFMYFDAIECLPDYDTMDENEFKTDVESRYDAQIALFGKNFQQKLSDLNLFLVGAGAIGCEMLKNWAMMGIGTGDKGCIQVTDMDLIEKSNLNRQFLFRPKDVQQAKSTTAAKAIQSMNKNVSVKAFNCRVGADTESTFDDAFFEKLDGVCTALDNVDARLYMDHRCLFYQLPMFESGTLGTKGNTQVVVPHMTENYGASRDPPEKSIPICTLKNFPNAIEHTLQWARDWFEGMFFQTPNDVNQYLSVPSFLHSVESQQNTKVDTMERLVDNLVRHKPITLDECVVWSRFKFQELYGNQIKQLLFNFPLDQVTTTGTPFWSGPKRPPTPIDFDANDPLHMNFVIAVSNLRAELYGLVGSHDEKYFKKILSTIQVPDFVPKKGLKIATTEADAKKEPQPVADVDDTYKAMANELPSPSSLAGYRLAAIEFDKDNDYHMKVIVAASNLRARNYKIEEADLHQSRFIAGKIIPAIATTTALVTGLVCLEMYKVFQNKPIDAYKNGFIELSLPFFAFSEPIAPAFTKSKLKGKDFNWSAWDCIDMTEKDFTLKQFIDYFQEEYGLEVSMLSFGVTILYAMFSKKATINERMPMRMIDLAEKISKKTIPPSQKYLIFEVCACDEDDEDVELPYIRFRCRD